MLRRLLHNTVLNSRYTYGWTHCEQNGWRAVSRSKQENCDELRWDADVIWELVDAWERWRIYSLCSAVAITTVQLPPTQTIHCDLDTGSNLILFDWSESSKRSHRHRQWFSVHARFPENAVTRHSAGRSKCTTWKCMTWKWPTSLHKAWKCKTSNAGTHTFCVAENSGRKTAGVLKRA